MRTTAKAVSIDALLLLCAMGLKQGIVLLLLPAPGRKLPTVSASSPLSLEAAGWIAKDGKGHSPEQRLH